MDRQYVPSKRLEKYRQGRQYIEKCLPSSSADFQLILPKLLYQILVEDIVEIFENKYQYELCSAIVVHGGLCEGGISLCVVKYNNKHALMLDLYYHQQIQKYTNILCVDKEAKYCFVKSDYWPDQSCEVLLCGSYDEMMIKDIDFEDDYNFEVIKIENYDDV